MFDTIAGLPVHILVVHAVVVGVPVMSLVTIAVAARRPPQPWLWGVVALNALLLVVTFVATQAGEALRDRVGEAVVREHSELGDVMPWFVLAVLVVSVLVAVVRRGTGVARLLLVLAVVAGLAATVWVVRVGDSGSRAVWEGVVQSTSSGG